MPVTAQAVAQIGGTIATTVATIKDMKERRNVELALSRMSAEEQRKLNDKMLRQSSQNERLATLVNAVNQSNIELTKSKSARDLQTALIVIGASLAIVITVYFIKRKR